MRKIMKFTVRPRVRVSDGNVTVIPEVIEVGPRYGWPRGVRKAAPEREKTPTGKISKIRKGKGCLSKTPTIKKSPPLKEKDKTKGLCSRTPRRKIAPRWGGDLVGRKPDQVIRVDIFVHVTH